jgi:hypothetical protein
VRRGAVVAVAAVACVALAAATSAAAKTRSGTDFYNKRYCEILELKGLPPDGVVTVWNTVGLGDCPQDQWKAFDAASLAQEFGDTAVVLNGPRYFLMDAATGETGRVKSFHGMRLRKVATIAIRTPEDLVQTPYTERTIDRVNTWSWKKGRTIYELRSPTGATYVMQAYSQIRDPALTIGDLSSLGSRLALPEGWTYRSRKLKRDFTLTARGSATIVQDELLDTYQRT